MKGESAFNAKFKNAVAVKPVQAFLVLRLFNFRVNLPLLNSPFIILDTGILIYVIKGMYLWLRSVFTKGDFWLVIIASVRQKTRLYHPVNLW